MIDSLALATHGLIASDGSCGGYFVYRCDVPDTGVAFVQLRRRSDGEWLIAKTTQTTNVYTTEHANVSNNAGKDADQAWTDRASLTYASLHTLTGV